MTQPHLRPVWGADVPISMPLPPPAGEPLVVDMYGFAMTQFRLVHNLTAREYAELAVPVYQPRDMSVPVSQDDLGIDALQTVAVPVQSDPGSVLPGVGR